MAGRISPAGSRAETVPGEDDQRATIAQGGTFRWPGDDSAARRSLLPYQAWSGRGRLTREQLEEGGWLSIG